MVPALDQGTQGSSWASGAPPGQRRCRSTGSTWPMPGTDTAASLNAALAAGKHLLFTPGIYHLESASR